MPGLCTSTRTAARYLAPGLSQNGHAIRSERGDEKYIRGDSLCACVRNALSLRPRRFYHARGV
jgi:hypothetical protein